MVRGKQQSTTYMHSLTHSPPAWAASSQLTHTLTHSPPAWAASSQLTHTLTHSPPAWAASSQLTHTLTHLQLHAHFQLHTCTSSYTHTETENWPDLQTVLSLLASPPRWFYHPLSRRWWSASWCHKQAPPAWLEHITKVDQQSTPPCSECECRFFFSQVASPWNSPTVQRMHTVITAVGWH